VVLRRLALIYVLVVAGCTADGGSGDGAVTSTVEPSLGTGADARATTSVATTELATTTSAVPLVTALPEAACELGDVPTEGEITFVVGSKLYGVRPDGTGARCLALAGGEAGGEAGDIQWGPRGDRVLLGPAVVLDAAGRRASGFFADNPGVRWSQPTGTALIAPSLADARLIWRRSTDAEDRLDISFLDRTDSAVYHPAGKNILSVGAAEGGLYGVFLASNRGENLRPVATVADPATTVHDLAWDTGGAHAFFIHDHAGEFHLHDLSFPDLTLSYLVTSPLPLGGLVVADTTSIAWRIGECTGTTRTAVWLAESATSAQIGVRSALGKLSSEPVGWLTGGRLVLMARPSGCEGPGDLWMATAGDSQPVLVATGVERAAIRKMAATPADLPGDINAQAPG